MRSTIYLYEHSNILFIYMLMFVDKVSFDRFRTINTTGVASAIPAYDPSNNGLYRLYVVLC